MMDTQILMFFGGIGLFLLGMLIFTQGLKQLAGRSLRHALAIFTNGPVSGAATGAVTTALIQSSSATTVTAVGFVGAGLLTFPQALGIIFGANIGTTITGWVVAIIGFKLKLGTIVLPFLMLGVLLKLFARGRLAYAGWALAGFSLLFMGIDAMQQGMEPLRGVLTPDSFPNDSYMGRFLMLLLGVLITVITQSSSAGVATALVALGSQAISFHQAAAMVIGMDVGTTFTAALATLGGSTAMRRTGYAHVVYNVMTGVMAFFLLDLYWSITDSLFPASTKEDQQIALVGFHTLFNGLGVLLVLPFTKPFARLIERLVPEAGPHLVRHLDKRLLKDPAAASDAAMVTIREVALELFDIVHILAGRQKERAVDQSRLRRVTEAITATRGFTDKIRTVTDQEQAHQRQMAAMHTLDHLARLAYRCDQSRRVDTLLADAKLTRFSRLLSDSAGAFVKVDAPKKHEDRLNRLRDLLHKQRYIYRDHIVAKASRQELSADRALARLDSMRWLHRVAYHMWRISYHLESEFSDLAVPQEKTTARAR